MIVNIPVSFSYHFNFCMKLTEKIIDFEVQALPIVSYPLDLDLDTSEIELIKSIVSRSVIIESSPSILHRSWS